MSRLNWMREVLKDPSATGALSEDLQDVLAIVGEDKFIQLFDCFWKSGVYYSDTTVNALRRIYIHKHRVDNCGKIARVLGTSQVYVRRVKRKVSKE